MSLSSIVLTIAAAVAGCSGGSSLGPEPASGAPGPTVRAPGKSSPDVIELCYDETTRYENLTLRWLELADSRCPAGVTCVWAGQMLATVEVVHGLQGRIVVEMLRRAAREPEVSHALGFELRLLNVDPHPKKGITPERGDYVMSMEIRKP